ncbi:MAG: hypothetical protein ACFFKA_19130 [Candidatus Thorarchaeota archaeon]
MNFKRPRCESCGVKIYPKSTPFSRSDFLIGDLPSYCPSCGKEISNEKNAELEKYGTTFYCIWCIGFISFVIVLFIIFISL